MGASVSWLAARAPDQEKFFAHANIRPTETTTEFFESAISGAPLRAGWYVVTAQGCDHRLVNPSLLESLSVDMECVTCSVEEHVMASACSFWRNGAAVWEVTHDAQRGMFDLVAKGQLPENFEELRAKVFQEQEDEGGADAEVDLVFAVPLLLAQDLVGFKHDEEWKPLTTSAPRVFEDIAPQRPWWKRW